MKKYFFYFFIFWTTSSFGEVYSQFKNFPFMNPYFSQSSLSSILGLPNPKFMSMNKKLDYNLNKKIVDFCTKIDNVYKRLNWAKSPCLELPWTYDYISELGYPLIYWNFTDRNNIDEISKIHRNVTLILGGVHPDEKTPIHLTFRIAESLLKNPDLYKNSSVIIAPLVNPDGFFMVPQKRTNLNGVDLNRNFPTKTWETLANYQWDHSKYKDIRKFPGKFSNSEQGTRFQIDLITKYNPNKIISIHAPLAFLDLDFENQKVLKQMNTTTLGRSAKKLAKIISETGGNYTIKDFGVYPGSLGNYAGNERSIPTITLELNSTDARLVDKFWNRFSPGLLKAIQFEFKKQKYSSVNLNTEDVSSEVVLFNKF